MGSRPGREMRHYNDYMHDACVAVDAFLKRVFRRVHVDGPPISPEEINAHPTMLVSSHRSHMDYILLGIQFHLGLGIRNLRFAAGDNLTNMPWVGERFRSYGAFSVYRAKANSRNYFFELAEQVASMMDSGENVIVFPEGGRSYSGAMLEMKSGILGSAIMAAHRSPAKTFRYIPMTVVYEELPELRYFELLERGKRLRSESKTAFGKKLGNLYYFGADLVAFGKLILLSRIGRWYDTVHIDYGAPIDVRELVDVDGNYIAGSRNEFLAHRTSISQVGEKLRERLIAMYRILPSHLLAAALETQSDILRADAETRIAALVERAAAAGRNVKGVADSTPAELYERGVALLRKEKALRCTRSGLTVLKPTIIAYYTRTLDGI